MGIQGIRRDYNDDSIPNAGEYGKNRIGQWYGVPPNQPELLANLSAHRVEENEDGTITVEPSILVTLPHLNLSWHGFLTRGIWEEI